MNHYKIIMLNNLKKTSEL